MKRQTINLDVQKLIGRGYGKGWFTNCHCRYRVYKGARNTKKSYVMIGLEVLMKIFSDPRRNVLILRAVNTSNRYSTFSTLKKLIEQPDPMHPQVSLANDFHVNDTTMTITYEPTGQLILFDGLATPTKITSTRMPHGFLTDIYVEEAFEMEDYEGWRKVDGSLRGKLPDGLFHQITFCFNAWSKEHWLYEHFFRGRLEDDYEYLNTHPYQDWIDEDLVLDYGKGLYLHTSTFRVNEFRDKEIYDVAMQQLHEVAPDIYKVEALGMWGNSTEATYPEWNEQLIMAKQSVTNLSYACYAIGIDTGLSDGQGKTITDRVKSATTMQLVGVTADYGQLVCIEEYFHSNSNSKVKKTEPQLMEEIIETIRQWCITYADHNDLMKGVVLVYVDCADKGFREGLELVARKNGMYNIRFMGSTKIKIQTRVDFVRLLMAWGEYKVSQSCKNLIREIKNSRKGEKGKPREDIDDHAINANEYAWQPLYNRLKRWKTFKEH